MRLGFSFLFPIPQALWYRHMYSAVGLETFNIRGLAQLLPGITNTMNHGSRSHDPNGYAAYTLATLYYHDLQLALEYLEILCANNQHKEWEGRQD